MKNKFWKWLAIFAYKQINVDPKTIKLGVPGIRDVDAICKSYTPGTFTHRGFSHCDGDGHYLCNECRFYKGDDTSRL